MSPTFRHLNAILLISISISVSIVSSRPITTGPINHDRATSVVFKSSDGEKFEVKLHVALQSEAIRQMVIVGELSNKVELSFPNITAETMAMVMRYCIKHDYYDGAANNLTAVEEMKAFDKEYVNVHYDVLFKLILASNELKIKSLLDLASAKVADMIKGKTPEEIREMFKIEGSCVVNNPPTKKEYVQEKKMLGQSSKTLANPSQLEIVLRTLHNLKSFRLKSVVW